MNTTSSTRSGMTLVEMSIAIVIFGVAMAATFESMIATRHLASNSSAIDQIELDASLALREIGNDLTASGWEFVDTPNGQVRYAGAQIISGNPATGTYNAISAAQDRGMRYYPYVQLDDTPGTRFPWTQLDPALTGYPTLAQASANVRDHVGKLPSFQLRHRTGLLPGTDRTQVFGTANEADWTASYFARSQELIFLRAQLGAWNQTLDPTSPNSTWNYTNLLPASYAQQRPSSHQPVTLNFTYSYTPILSVATGRAVPGQQNTSMLTAADWQTADNQAKLGVLYPSGFVPTSPSTWAELFPANPYGVVLDAGWFDPNDSNGPIKPLWESMEKLTIPSGGAASFWGVPAQGLREFMYAVVPSTVAGSLGRLVRAYRVDNPTAYPSGRADPGYRITVQGNDSDYFIPPATGVPLTSQACAMVVDKVLAENVVRMVFDTYRSVNDAPPTVTTLGPNQIRVRLYLARRQMTNPNVLLSRMVESVISMRTRNSSGEMTVIQGVLGTTPIGITR